MADFLVEVQPHERGPETTKGHDMRRSPLGFDRWNFSATHAVRPTAASMANGAVSAWCQSPQELSSMVKLWLGAF